MIDGTGLARLDLIVRLESPLRIGGTGVDVRRDTTGRPCLPAAALKGRARVEACQLCYALDWPTCDRRAAPCQPGDSARCPLCTVFGGRGIAGQVFFADSVADAEPVLTALVRGQRSEAVLALAAGTHCSGTLRHRLPAAASREFALLVVALLAIDRLGAQNGIGWGRCQIQITTPVLDLAAVRSALWTIL